MSCNMNEDLEYQVNMKVNGQEVELNCFVQNFISQTILGMVKSLRGVDGVDSINLAISKEVK